jgi:hypothetical protein
VLSIRQWSKVVLAQAWAVMSPLDNVARSTWFAWQPLPSRGIATASIVKFAQPGMRVCSVHRTLQIVLDGALTWQAAVDGSGDGESVAVCMSCTLPQSSACWIGVLYQM